MSFILFYFYYFMNPINNTNTSNSTSNFNTDSVNSHGIVLSTRPVTTHAMKPAGDSALSDDQDPIHEQAWTLSDMLERFSFKATYPWLGTQTSHTVLANLRIPQDLLVNTITSTPFQAFTYWRGDVELRPQVTATPFHQGMVVCAFIPLCSDTQTLAIVSNFAALTANPCIYLFPNTNTAGILKIPFNSPYKYLDLTAPVNSFSGTLGRFVIVVFNPIQFAAGSSDTASVSLFSRFVNNKFKVPRISTVQGPFMQAVPQSGAARAKVKETATNVSGGLISKMVDKILPENAITDTLLPMLATLLDKPTDPNQQPVAIQMVGRMNFHDGVEHIDKLVVDPSQMYESDSCTFGTHADEMSIDYLKKRFTYLGSFNVATSDDPGKVLASVPINPLPSTLLVNKQNKVSLLEYLSIPFAYWRGGITFKLVVVATSLQTLKLFAAFNFNQYAPPSTMPLNVATSQYGEAFEINQGTNTIEFTVPYVSNTEYKFAPTGNTYNSLNSIGYLNFVVLNRLVAPSNTPIAITINVFIAGAEDFELSTLTYTNDFISAVPQSSEVAPHSTKVKLNCLKPLTN